MPVNVRDVSDSVNLGWGFIWFLGNEFSASGSAAVVFYRGKLQPVIQPILFLTPGWTRHLGSVFHQVSQPPVLLLVGVAKNKVDGVDDAGFRSDEVVRLGIAGIDVQVLVHIPFIRHLEKPLRPHVALDLRCIRAGMIFIWRVPRLGGDQAGQAFPGKLGQACDSDVVIKEDVGPGKSAQVGLDVPTPAKLTRPGELDGQVGRPVVIDIVLSPPELPERGYASFESFRMDSR